MKINPEQRAQVRLTNKLTHGLMKVHSQITGILLALRPDSFAHQRSIAVLKLMTEDIIAQVDGSGSASADREAAARRLASIQYYGGPNGGNGRG